MTHTGALNLARFQHDRVRMLIAAFDLPDDERRRCTAAVRDAGPRGSNGALTFHDLDASGAFPACPVRLQDWVFSGDNLDRVTMAYTLNFGKSFLYHLYLERWQTRGPDDDRPFGLVMNMPGVRGGVVVHDAVLPEAVRTALTHRPGYEGHPAEVTLEHYQSFLGRLVRHWRGGGPVPAACHYGDVRPRLERWMVERLGTGPALVVFAWLAGAWLDPRRRFVVVRLGAPCLSLTQPLIARQTGLGADSVKHALATLRREGLVATRRGDRRTYLTPAVPAAAADATGG